MMAHLPALLIVVPLLSAPICLLIGRGRFAHGVALVVSWVTFVMSALLLNEVRNGGAISYHLGGWAPP